jgi:hypothetical protein
MKGIDKNTSQQERYARCEIPEIDKIKNKK